METSPCEVGYPRKCTRLDVYENHQNRWLLEKIIKLKKRSYYCSYYWYLFRVCLFVIYLRFKLGFTAVRKWHRCSVTTSSRIQICFKMRILSHANLSPNMGQKVREDDWPGKASHLPLNRKCHNHTLQTNQRYRREEEKQNTNSHIDDTKTLSSIFLIEMIAKLERTQSTV